MVRYDIRRVGVLMSAWSARLRPAVEWPEKLRGGGHGVRVARIQRIAIAYSDIRHPLPYHCRSSLIAGCDMGIVFTRRGRATDWYPWRNARL